MTIYTAGAHILKSNYSLATQEFFLLQYDQETSVEFYAIKPSGKDEEPAFFLV